MPLRKTFRGVGGGIAREIIDLAKAEMLIITWLIEIAVRFCIILRA